MLIYCTYLSLRKKANLVSLHTRHIGQVRENTSKPQHIYLAHETEKIPKELQDISYLLFACKEDGIEGNEKKSQLLPAYRKKHTRTVLKHCFSPGYLF